MTTITGTIHHIKDTETIGDKGFKKRLIVIKTAAQYDGLIPIEAKKDDCARLDAFAIGQQVKADIYIGGREWNGRYFPSLTLKSIEAASGHIPHPKRPDEAKPGVAPIPEPINDNVDDLPF